LLRFCTSTWTPAALGPRWRLPAAGSTISVGAAGRRTTHSEQSQEAPALGIVHGP